MPTLADPDDTSRLRARLAALRPDAPRRWGTMSTGEMLRHLVDSFDAVLGQRETGLRAPVRPRRFMRWFALHVPFPWPRGLPTSPGVDPHRGGSRPGAFEDDRAELDRHLATFAARAGTCAPHPIFGAMSADDWTRWGWLHVDHHLRQFGA